jgi:uncharacterized protein YndB with AHSA1/START domain
MLSHQHEAILDAPADSVFATLTDIERLPQWNDAIVSVIARPDRLVPGAEWVVRMRALGQSWPSRSTVIDYAPAERRFRYRSCTDDGNPSWAEWTWTVAPVDGSRSRVVLTWTLHPKSFWRRVLLARIRARQLRRGELPSSLARLTHASTVTAKDESR